MSVHKFLLDEHVDPRLQKLLRRTSPDLITWCIGDPGAPALGALDPDLLVWCDLNGFSFVTNNRASMPAHLVKHLEIGQHVPGILTLNQNMSLAETAEELLLIWQASEPEEYADQILYLSLSE
jgi:Domain of unknown function (DUF5615)